MKANLPQNEPRILAEWEQSGLYQRIQQARADAPSYVLHDGPPYPTGTIHLGTGLNKILKDMVVKSKTMAGFRAPYVPGWDCHGLADRDASGEGTGREGQGPAGGIPRASAATFAARFVDQHRRDFKRLGVFGQWEKPYLTMSPEYEACIADAFLTFLEKGYVYRGLKPVYWCIYDRTALAEAEVEYEDHTSPSIWIRYAVVQAPAESAATRGAKTLRAGLDDHSLDAAGQHGAGFPSALRVRAGRRRPRRHVHPGERSGRQGDAGNGRDAARRAEGPCTGNHSRARSFRHPFLDREVPGVLADYVTLEQGTGIVHTAPGHGADDYRTGQKYGLDTYAPLDDDGRFIEGLPEYKGKTVFEANPAVIELLKSRGTLCRREQAAAQLSALLALPQSGHLPRHRAMVHSARRRKRHRSRAQGAAVAARRARAKFPK